MFSLLEWRKTWAASSDPTAGFALVRRLNKRPYEVSPRLNYPGWIQNFWGQWAGTERRRSHPLNEREAWLYWALSWHRWWASWACGSGFLRQSKIGGIVDVCCREPGEEEKVLPEVPFPWRIGKKQDPKPWFYKNRFCIVPLFSWKDPMRESSGEKSPKELILNITWSNSRMVFTNQQEAK